MKLAVFLTTSVLIQLLAACTGVSASVWGPSAPEQNIIGYSDYQPTDSQEILIPAYYARLNVDNIISRQNRNPNLYLTLNSEENFYSLNAQLAVRELSFIGSYIATQNKNNSIIQQVDNTADNSLIIPSYFDTQTDRNTLRSNNEKTWQTGIHYDFSNIVTPGLTLGYFFSKSGDSEWMHQKKDEEKLNEYKHSIKVGYAFQKQSLKGLSLKFEYSHQHLKKNAELPKKQDKIKSYKNNSKASMGLYINYTINVF